MAELIVAGLTRPFPGETVSGDTFFHTSSPTGCRICVIDGAGHGRLANQASTIARDTLLELASQPVDVAFRACHSRLHGTRGAVVSIVDVTGDVVSFSGVGNVDARLISPTGQHRFAPDRGLLGASFPRLHTWTHPIESTSWRLLVFSDGVMQRMHLEWQDVADLSEADALVERLLAKWGRSTDDATLVIAGPP